MEAKRREGAELRYIAIEPDGYDPDRAYPMFILLHGFGAHMGDLAGIAPAIDAAGYVYICPNAPLSVEIGPGMTGFAWTPPRDLRAVGDVHRPAPDMDAAVAAASRAADMLQSLTDEVAAEYNTPPGDILLGGFSQGGMMTYRVGLPSPERFKGLAALSGAAPYPDALRPLLPPDRGQPVFVAHGTDDAVLPLQSGRDAAEFLRAEGYAPEYREYEGMAHEIRQDVIADLAAWAHKTLPPARGR